MRQITSTVGGMPAALHGLAALAAASVVLNAAGVLPSAGGRLGVDVLLVVVGFLSTTVALDEFDRTGRVRLTRHLVEVVRRSGPTVWAMLLVVCAVLLVMGADHAGRIKGEAAAALGYASNWWLAAEGAPSEADHLSPLGQVWPVALVVQVLVVWMAVLALAVRIGGPAAVRTAALAGAGASAAVMIVVGMLGDGDPTRLLVGPETRAFGFLLGAALATTALSRASRRPPGIQGRLLWDLFAAVVTAALIGLLVTGGDPREIVDRGGTLAASVVAAAGVVAYSGRVGVAATLLRARIVAWVGTRAYALLVWHWPVLVATGPDGWYPWEGAAGTSIRLSLVIAAAALSYRLVEHPVASGAIGAAFDRLRRSHGPDFVRLRRRIHGTFAAITATACAVAGGMLLAPSGPATDDVAAAAEAEVVPEPVDCATTPCVALTFDDGPGAPTDDLLEILAEKEVTATFFMIGKQVAARPDVARAVHDAGHEIGVHTWSHADLVAVGPEAARDQLRRGAEAVTGVTGRPPALYRPPYGSTDSAVRAIAAELGMAEILWDVDTRDWQHRVPARTIALTLDGASNGSIVLLHDSRPTTVEAVPELIDGLRDAGLTLVPVSTLLDGLLGPGVTLTSRPVPDPTPTTPAVTTG